MTLRELRRQAGLTQAGLASRAGVNVQTVSLAETGRLRLSRQQSAKIANALGVEPCEVRELAAVCETKEAPTGAAEAARG